jgi:hypothetical protein
MLRPVTPEVDDDELAAAVADAARQDAVLPARDWRDHAPGGRAFYRSRLVTNVDVDLAIDLGNRPQL